MSKVWIIESGSYSDYNVHCVCATEAEADRVVEKLTAIDDLNDYKEYRHSERWIATADDIVAAHEGQVRHPWDADKAVYDFDADPIEEVASDEWRVVAWMFRQDDPEVWRVMHSGRDDQGRLRGPYLVTARSPDPDSALKAARDRLAFLRAQEEGLT